MTASNLTDDHVETEALRTYGKGARCLVIGAYKGDTMLYLLEHGATHVAGVEPQEWAYRECVDRMVAYTKEHPLPNGATWTVDQLALVPWETDKYPWATLQMAGTDGASMVMTPPPDDSRQLSELSPAMNIHEWWTGRCRHDDFDLVVMNCEGAEYWLLPYFVRWAGARVLVQFHGPPIPERQLAVVRREYIGKGWYLYA